MRPTAVEDIPSSVSMTLVETEIDDDSTSKDKVKVTFCESRIFDKEF
jgi:hypothetical protein